MSPQRTVRLALGSGGLLSLWFITMAGGWSDIADFVLTNLWASQTSEETIGKPIVGSVLIGGDVFGLPTQIVVDGVYLHVIDRYGRSAVVAVNRDSGNIARSFGRKGEGPGEFMTPVSLVAIGSEVAVLDAGLNRITWLAADANTNTYTVSRTTQISLESVVTDFSVASDDRFLVAGFLGVNRLAHLTREGGFLGHVGVPPNVDGLPAERRSEVFQGSLRSDVSGTRHVVTSRFASHIEIFDDAADEMRTAWGPERFEPRSGRYVTRFGYLDSAPMSDGFLALYSGRTREEYPGRANYGAIIDEFGWDGTHRARYELDADVITIAWSEPDRRLYAVRHDPIPAILVYTIGR